MSFAWYGEALIASLLVICSARIFFIRREGADRLSTLSAIAFIASVLQILAHGASALSLLLCVAACFSFITNMHAIARLAMRLFIDHYSALFVVFSIITLVVSALLLFVIVYFADITVNPASMRPTPVVETRLRYYGTFREGFAQVPPFGKANADVRIFEAADTSARSEVVILVTDKRAGLKSYLPYIAFLAEGGCTVVTGEFDEGNWLPPPFGARTFRRMSMVMQYIVDKTEFDRQKEFCTFASAHEYEALLDIAAERFGSGKRCLVSDAMSQAAAVEVARERNKAKQGSKIRVFALQDVIAAPGFGFVQQTDPLLAWALGLPRERKLDAPRKAAMATIERRENDTE